MNGGAGTARRAGLAAHGHEAAAALLDAHDDYRVLRRLKPRPVLGRRPLVAGERLSVILDVETTGLDPARDEIIELGMIAVAHDGRGGIIGVMDAFNALREPSVPIPPEVTRLTGITPEAVAGRTIDGAVVEAFIADASLVVAHNAQFDRPFCEALAKGFGPKAWGCSIRDIGWGAAGVSATKLGYLLAGLGLFHEGHRGLDDCHALLEVLAAPLPGGAASAFAGLLASVERDVFRIWAIAAPFDRKDDLRRRGYRWSDGSDGRPRAWWIDLHEDAAAAERADLQHEVYGNGAEPLVQRLSASDRYRRG